MDMRVNEVIVVEGKNDVAKVKSSVDAFVVSTSGSHISHQLIKMLKQFNQERGLILFFDPDNAGEKIRSLIAEQIVDVKHAFIKKSDCQIKGDIGVEHASVSVIRESLNNVISYQNNKSDLLFVDMIELGLANTSASRLKRESLCNALNLTYANAKTLYKRLLMLNITKADLTILMENLNVRI